VLAGQINLSAPDFGGANLGPLTGPHMSNEYVVGKRKKKYIA